MSAEKPTDSSIENSPEDIRDGSSYWVKNKKKAVGATWKASQERFKRNLAKKKISQEFEALYGHYSGTKESLPTESNEETQTDKQTLASPTPRIRTIPTKEASRKRLEEKYFLENPTGLMGGASERYRAKNVDTPNLEENSLWKDNPSDRTIARRFEFWVEKRKKELWQEYQKEVANIKDPGELRTEKSYRKISRSIQSPHHQSQ